MNDIHETLGGNVPPPLPPFPHPTRIPPVVPQDGRDPQAQTIVALQTQLGETQAALAGHVERIRNLENLLTEQEVIKREVSALREQMAEARREMVDLNRSRGHGAPSFKVNGFNHSSGGGERESDDDDNRSIASVETVTRSTWDTSDEKDGDDKAEEARSEEREKTVTLLNGLDGLRRPSSPKPSSSLSEHDGSSREKELREQNAALESRLEALSLQLEETTKLGQSLRTQHALASEGVRTLEERIQGLEEAVEGRVAAAYAEAESRLEAWKRQFEDGWKRERESWETEREHLRQLVREWEEARSEPGSDWEEGGGGDSESASSGASLVVERSASPSGGGGGGLRPNGKARRRQRPRRRRRGSLANVAEAVPRASDSDSTSVPETKAVGTEAGIAAGSRWGWSLAPSRNNIDRRVPKDSDMPSSASWDDANQVCVSDPLWFGSSVTDANRRGQMTALPYISAASVVIIGITAWALVNKD
jgi:hypothetical protein